MKQKPSQHKLGDFLEGKGFYIVLFLCVAAIGISGYFLFSGLFAQPEGFGGENTSAVSGQAEMPQEDAAGQTAGETTPAPQEDGTAGISPQEDTSAASTDTGDTQEDSPDEEAAASSGYVWPVEGSVDRDFSLEVFAYDETMGDWRTHEGIDINAQLGAPVSACAKGTVTDVTTDDMMGVTVTVDHGSGWRASTPIWPSRSTSRWARRWRRARCWAPWGPPPSPRAPLPVTCTLHCGSTG